MVVCQPGAWADRLSLKRPGQQVVQATHSGWCRGCVPGTNAAKAALATAYVGFASGATDAALAPHRMTVFTWLLPPVSSLHNCDVVLLVTPYPRLDDKDDQSSWLIQNLYLTNMRLSAKMLAQEMHLVHR